MYLRNFQVFVLIVHHITGWMIIDPQTQTARQKSLDDVLSSLMIFLAEYRSPSAANNRLPVIPDIII